MKVILGNRILAVILVVAIGLSLTACVGATGSSGGSTTAPSAAEPAAPSNDSVESSVEDASAPSSVETVARTVVTVVGDQASNKPADGTLRIGVLSYLSDSKATMRKYFQIGWETAAKMAFEKGMLEGYDTVEFVVFDPGTDGAMVKQRLTECVDMGCVGLLHSCGDGLTASSAQWAEANKFPVVSGPNSNTAITLYNYSDYYWTGGTKMAWTVGKLIAQNAIEDGKKNAAYVGADGAACQDAINFMLWEGQKLDPDFNLIADYRVNDNDFTGVVSAVMGQQPDMILEQGGGATLVSFMQTAQQYDLFSTIDVYNDFPADSATGAPMVAAGTFPFGKLHGVVQLAYWDDEYMVGDMARFMELTTGHELAKGMDYFAPVSCVSCYYTISSLLFAMDDMVKNGIDLYDKAALNEALGKVRWEDSLGEHFYRDFDHQLTNMIWYGTSDTANEENGSPICSNVKRYSWEEAMPSKADYRAYCESIGFDHQGRFDD